MVEELAYWWASRRGFNKNFKKERRGTPYLMQDNQISFQKISTTMNFFYSQLENQNKKILPVTKVYVNKIRTYYINECHFWSVYRTLVNLRLYPRISLCSKILSFLQRNKKIESPVLARRSDIFSFLQFWFKLKLWCQLWW